MAPKLKSDPIGVADLNRYLATESDFDFELRVLHALREFGLNCEHGGHYEDPVTKKSREFDIRLRRSEGNYHFFAAIECKNLREYFPLLISCVPRTDGEAWHQVVDVRDRQAFKGIGMSAGLDGRSTIRKFEGTQSRYFPRDWVRKSTAQVGVTSQAEVYAQDSEIYEKWGQSLASLHDFGGEIEQLPDRSYAMAIPIVVVPDGRLWQAAYAANGTRVRDPEPVDSCAVYAGGAEFRLGLFETYSVSHVEIMTRRGLLGFVQRSLRSLEGLHQLFVRRQDS
jgi:hypothetical protein